MSARKRIYHFLKKNGSGKFKGSVLAEIADIRDWPRTIRQLKQDGVLNYEYDKAQDPYHFTRIGEYSGSKRQALTSKDKYRIRHRDGHRCQSCGRGVNEGVVLHVDHKIPLDWEGTDIDSNLWTLCSDCNLAKKSFFRDDFDREVMKMVVQEKSGYQKLKVLFENSPERKFPPSILQGIAGIRDWTRTIRNIRLTHKLNIQWIASEEGFPDGYYIYLP